MKINKKKNLKNKSDNGAKDNEKDVMMTNEENNNLEENEQPVNDQQRHSDEKTISENNEK